MTDYNKLRQKARELYEQSGVYSISGHIGVGGNRATSIDEVADENLSTVIGDKIIEGTIGH